MCKKNKSKNEIFGEKIYQIVANDDPRFKSAYVKSVKSIW